MNIILITIIIWPASQGAVITGIPIRRSNSLQSSLCCWVTLTKRREYLSTSCWSPDSLAAARSASACCLYLKIN